MCKKGYQRSEKEIGKRIDLSNFQEKKTYRIKEPIMRKLDMHEIF